MLVNKSSLSVVAKELNTVDVCAAFGLFIKFTVSLDEPGVSSTLDVSKNAFEVMMQAFFDHCCPIRHYSFCMKNVATVNVRSASQSKWIMSTSRAYIFSQIQ